MLYLRVRASSVSPVINVKKITEMKKIHIRFWVLFLFSARDGGGWHLRRLTLPEVSLT